MSFRTLHRCSVLRFFSWCLTTDTTVDVRVNQLSRPTPPSDARFPFLSKLLRFHSMDSSAGLSVCLRICPYLWILSMGWCYWFVHAFALSLRSYGVVCVLATFDVRGTFVSAARACGALERVRWLQWSEFSLAPRKHGTTSDV